LNGFLFLSLQNLVHIPIQEVYPLYNISNSMEIDSVAHDEVKQTEVLDLPLGTVDPLAIDLQLRCSIFLKDLGVTSTTNTRLPVDIAQVILDYAFAPDTARSPAALLETLSELLAIDGLTKNVVHAFGPILLDLLARWMDITGSIISGLWEARLSTVAYLAALRPDLWTYVACVICC
jgi:hypothetical protein